MDHEPVILEKHCAQSGRRTVIATDEAIPILPPQITILILLSLLHGDVHEAI